MKNKKLLDKLMYLFIIFVIGSIIGWLYEEIFYFFTEGKLTNRGVLFGPWLPIYGIGAVCLYYLKPLKKHPVLLFLLSMLITGIVEYIIGYISVNVYGNKLWDYSGLFLNIDGLVCLRSVVSFAIGGLAFHYLLLPFMDKIYDKVKFKHVEILCTVLIAIFVLDIIISYFFRTPITY